MFSSNSLPRRVIITCVGHEIRHILHSLKMLLEIVKALERIYYDSHIIRYTNLMDICFESILYQNAKLITVSFLLRNL